MLDQFSPQQRQAIMLGAPVVAVFALVSVLKGKTAAPTPTTGQTLPAAMPSTDAIGTSQLSEFESLLTGSIQQLGSQVGNIQDQLANQPAPAATSTAPWTPQFQNIDSGAYPVLAQPGTSMDILGTITGRGGQFTGGNVAGGAPVYAYINGTWQQDYNSKTLPIGTPLATPTTFQGNIVPGATVTEIL